MKKAQQLICHQHLIPSLTHIKSSKSPAVLVSELIGKQPTFNYARALKKKSPNTLPFIFTHQQPQQHWLCKKYSMASNHQFIDLEQLALKLFRGIWSTEQEFTTTPYHLIDNMYHEESGLFSEGCWHNFVMGLNYIHILRNTQYHSFSSEYTIKEKLRKLAHSVLNLNFDKRQELFFMRQPSGIWQNVDESEMQERKEFWRPHMEKKKLISNAMALLFYSTLPHEYLPSELNLDRLCNSIIANFYDEETKLWKTTASSDPKECPVTSQHYRLVDHALVYLALLRFSLKATNPSIKDRVDGLTTELLSTILLRFKVESIEDRISYLDDNLQQFPKRFLWQECWVVIALIASKKCNSVVSKLVGNMFWEYLDEETGFLFSESIGSIKDTSTIQIKDNGKTKRKISPNTHQMFCSFINDNSLFYWILSNRHLFCSADELQKEWKEYSTSFKLYLEKATVRTPVDSSQRLFISDYFLREGLWANSETIFALLGTINDLLAVGDVSAQSKVNE